MSEQINKPPSPALLIAAVGLAAAVLAGAAIMLLPTRPTVTTLQTGPAIGGPFQLVDETGATRDQSLLKGKWSAVFFGFTSCPDVCPMTLQGLSQAQEKLGDRAGNFQIVFISVDPRRDTPAQVKAWMESQKPPAGTIALTGSQAQVDAAAKAYRAFASVTGEGDKTDVSHSSTIYLMNPQGEFAKPLVFNQPPEQIAAEIETAMKGA